MIDAILGQRLRKYDLSSHHAFPPGELHEDQPERRSVILEQRFLLEQAET